MDEYQDKFEFPYLALIPIGVVVIDTIHLSKNGGLFIQENTLLLWIYGVVVAEMIFFVMMNLAGFDYFKFFKDEITVVRFFKKQKYRISDYKNFRIRKQGSIRCLVANNRSSGKIKIILTEFRLPVKLEYLLERINNQENLQ